MGCDYRQFAVTEAGLVEVEKFNKDWAVNKKDLEPIKQDMVNHPAHYNKCKYEPIEVIMDWGLGFNLGNTVKYISRCEHKGKKLEDLEKAMWYLKYEIDKIKAGE